MLIVLLMCFIPEILYAQMVNGRVSDESGKPLQGATVKWSASPAVVLTDEAGLFQISRAKKSFDTLLISCTGYKEVAIAAHDSIPVTVLLERTGTLADVRVVAQQQSHYIGLNPVKTEVINSLELKKAACCDLAGCFETQASVQPQTTNIITNSKELRILGLSGIYNQVLVDGFPMVQALTYTYGISSIPGPALENIFISKGANSVLQGFESISGQINVLTKEPDKADKLFLNGYINSFGEKHLNALFAQKNKTWSNLTTLHIVQPAGRFDRDDDNFLDLPLLTRYTIANRWKKGDENKWGWSTQANARYLSEKRIGGQTSFDVRKDKGSSSVYGQSVEIDQPEFWFKTAYRKNDMHRLALYTSGFYQKQSSYFGVTSYHARQTNGYINLQHEINTRNNILKAGLSYRHLKLSEEISFSENSLDRTYAGTYRKEENIPGVFAENVLKLFRERLTWIAAIRADHHNQFGWQLSPRTLIKYDFSDKLTVRGSVGTGWRTANIFSENTGLLASSRDIVFAEPLQPEKALNTGINATQKFRFTNVEGYLSFDYYYTSFQNQIFPDYDVTPTKAIIQNFRGASVSNGFQFEVSGTFFKRVAAKFGYVNLDVYQVKSSMKQDLPFNPRHRINGSFSYMPLNKTWHIDANVHWYGTQRLPDTRTSPLDYQRPATSQAYTIVNLQASKSLKKFEFYGGVENVFNFRQLKPIIGWQNPFGQFFDTQFAWGPTRGRELYMGVRFTIK